MKAQALVPLPEKSLTNSLKTWRTLNLRLDAQVKVLKQDRLIRMAGDHLIRERLPAELERATKVSKGRVVEIPSTTPCSGKNPYGWVRKKSARFRHCALRHARFG